MKNVLYPGSFDPITYGHMDIIDQALNIYDKVIIGIAVNSKKNSGMFTREERKALIEEIYKDNTKVEVITTDENVASVDVALNNDCTSMVRGLRDLTDFAEELKLATINNVISDKKVNTVAFFANPNNITVSSTSVKELFRLGKDISNFVHPIVYEAIKNKMRSDNDEN